MAKGKRIGIGIAAVVVVAAIGGYAASKFFGDKAKEAVDGFIAQLPPGTTAKYGDFHYDPLTGTLSLNGVSVSNSGFAGAGSCDIKQIVVKHPSGAGTDADPFKAGSIHYDEAVAQGDVPFCPHDLDASDIVLVGKDAAAVHGPEKLFSVAGVGRLVSAGSVDVHKLEGKSDGGPVTIDHLHLENYGGGRLGSLLIENFDARNAKNPLHVAKLAASDLDLAGLNDVFDPAAYPGGHPAWTDRRTLIGKLEIAGFNVPGPNDKMGAGIDSLRVEGFAGHPFAKPPAKSEGRDANVEAADIAKSLAVSAFIIDGFHAEAHDQSGGFKIGHLDISHYDGGKDISTEWRDLDFDLPEQQAKVHLGLIQLHDVNITRLLDMLPQVRDAETFRLFMAMKAKALVTAADATIKDVSVNAGPYGTYTLASIGGTNTYKDGQLAAVKGEMVGLTVPVKQLAGLLGPEGDIVTQSLGDQISIDAAGDYAFDAATKKLTVNQYDYTAKGLGKLHLEGVIDNLAPGGPPTSVFENAALEKAVLRWDDQSLTNRLFNLFAKLKGVSPDDLKAEAMQQVQAVAPLLPNQPDAVTQIANYLKEPHALVLTLQPEQPVSLSQIRDTPAPMVGPLLNIQLKSE